MSGQHAVTFNMFFASHCACHLALLHTVVHLLFVLQSSLAESRDGPKEVVMYRAYAASSIMLDYILVPDMYVDVMLLAFPLIAGRTSSSNAYRKWESP